MKPPGPAGEGPSLRKAKPNAPAAEFGGAVPEDGGDDALWVGELVPKGVSNALGAVGIVPCIQRAYLHLDEDRGDVLIGRTRNDILPVLCLLQLLVYASPVTGWWRGVQAERGGVVLIFALCLLPVLLLVAWKTSKTVVLPPPVQREPRNTAYYAAVLAMAVETVQLSALSFNSGGHARNPLAALTFDTANAHLRIALFWLAVVSVAAWVAAVAAAAYLSRKHGDNHGVAWVAGATEALNALFVTLVICIMRAMNCDAAAPEACWAAPHAAVLLAGAWAVNHLIVAVMMFGTVVKAQLGRAPPRAGQYPADSPLLLPWFGVADRLGKFVCCGAAVLAPNATGRNPAVVSTFLLVHVALLVLSRRGDLASFAHPFHSVGPYSPPSLNAYLTLSYFAVVWCACVASTHGRAEAPFSAFAAVVSVGAGWGALGALLFLQHKRLPNAAHSGNSPFGRVTVHVDRDGGPRDTSITPADGASNADEGWHACDDQEAEEDYCPGGYHRVKPHDTYNQYQVIAKLGWGQFSTVWLVRHTMRNELSALKICKATPEFRAASMYEIEILQGLSKRIAAADDPSQACVINLFDHFEINGPNGVHVSMAMELLGPNLLKMISNADFKGIDLNIVRMLTKNILKGLKFLDEAGVIHTDLKPENILVEVQDDSVLAEIAKYSNTNPADLEAQQACNRDILHGRVALMPQEGLTAALDRCYRVKITDFGAARWDTKTYPVATVQTREYRCPEVLLGVQKLTTKIDMWSLACITFELVTGDFLFDPKRQKEVDMDIYHWMLFQRLLGDVPPSVAASQGKYQGRYFDATGRFKHGALAPVPLCHYIHTKYLMHIEAAEQLATFLTPILHFDPSQRASAAETLTDPWLDIVC
eukprot:TRINITY_DN877_c1_g2_i1.p1 TRINITY_DN877_c1_g2~~TRINITY_DN877_c1_g2_i1.p1  ORF type:complete len:874 (+),score=301.60 TRINITY_DN877_c1_g2_i1:80-2701(+)